MKLVYAAAVIRSLCDKANVRGKVRVSITFDNSTGFAADEIDIPVFLLVR